MASETAFAVHFVLMECDVTFKNADIEVFNSSFIVFCGKVCSSSTIGTGRSFSFSLQENMNDIFLLNELVVNESTENKYSPEKYGVLVPLCPHFVSPNKMNGQAVHTFS